MDDCDEIDDHFAEVIPLSDSTARLAIPSLDVDEVLTQEEAQSLRLEINQRLAELN